jgi:hypothetical protein
MPLSPVTSLWAEAWRLACIAGLRWAMREIHPLHEDVPYITRRLAELERP